MLQYMHPQLSLLNKLTESSIPQIVKILVKFQKYYWNALKKCNRQRQFYQLPVLLLILQCVTENLEQKFASAMYIDIVPLNFTVTLCIQNKRKNV